ncbi:MAG TPA: HDOD domain-containing protein [Candidatus Sumerlaeota bacterium]|nr:HDOD domain-containing protein [Candidatus Sumerlaeota bacterium]HPS01364.1 HDOD domain-containing protein [Candidatus Sumerlaeota bacterium]
MRAGRSEKHILLVDDERSIRQPLVYELRKAGFFITQADNGKVALDAIHAAQDAENPVDLVITDIQMPIMSGMDLLAEIRKQRINVPVILMSGYSTKETVVELKRLGGCQGLVVKPFSPQDILARVHKILTPEIRGTIGMPLPAPPAGAVRLVPGGLRSPILRPPDALRGGRPEVERGAQLRILNFIATFSNELNNMLEDPDLVLPVESSVALQLRQVLNQKHVSFDDVARIVSHDPALAARVLQVANSSIYASLERARNLKQAVSRLGLLEVCNILNAIVTRDLFKAQSKHLQDVMHNLWLHSICTAYINQLVVRHLNLPAGPDFFMMGLLHDIGKLLILYLVHLGEKSGRWKEGEVSEDILMPFFAMRHHDLGMRLLQNWDYPDSFLKVVRLHNDDRNIHSHDESVVVTFFSNLLTRKLGFSLVPYVGDPLTNNGLVTALNLSRRTINDIELAVLETIENIRQSSLVLE